MGRHVGSTISLRVWSTFKLDHGVSYHAKQSRSTSKTLSSHPSKNNSYFKQSEKPRSQTLLRVIYSHTIHLLLYTGASLKTPPNDHTEILLNDSLSLSVKYPA